MSDLTVEDFTEAAQRAIFRDTKDDSIKGAVQEANRPEEGEEDDTPQTEMEKEVREVANEVQRRVKRKLWPNRYLEIQKEMYRMEIMDEVKERLVAEELEKVMEKRNG